MRTGAAAIVAILRFSPLALAEDAPWLGFSDREE